MSEGEIERETIVACNTLVPFCFIGGDNVIFDDDNQNEYDHVFAVVVELKVMMKSVTNDGDDCFANTCRRSEQSCYQC
eukprot:68820-Hanusia_phi.AAC.1